MFHGRYFLAVLAASSLALLTGCDTGAHFNPLSEASGQHSRNLSARSQVLQPRPLNGTSGSQSGLPLFSGPDTVVGQGGGATFQALARQQNCTLTDVLERIPSLAFPLTGMEAQTIPNYEAYLHKISMLQTTGDVFAKGCVDPTITGEPSPLAVVLDASATSFTTAIYLNGSIYVGESTASGNLSLPTQVNAPGVIDMLADSFDATASSNDLVALTPTQFQVYRSNLNNSTLTGLTPVTLPGYGFSMVSGAFTSSGHKDLIVTGGATSTGGTGSILFYKGNGDGTFAAPTTVSTGSTLRYVELAADVNNDGKLDLITIDTVPNSVTYQLDILIGNGDGTFTANPSFMLYGLGSAAVADLNGDGKVDLVIDQPSIGALIVAKGSNSAVFTQEAIVPTLGTPGQLAITDVDGDGVADIVLGKSSNGFFGPTYDYFIGSNMHVLLGTGNFAYSTPSYLLPSSAATFAGGQNSFAAGDVNGDGAQDMVALENGANVTARTYLNTSGILAPGPPSAFGLIDVTTNAMAVADINGDGKADVIAAGSDPNTGNYAVQAGLGTSTGSFTMKAVRDTPAPVAAIAIGGFTTSGHMDLALACNDSFYGSSNGLYIAPGNGDGTFGTPVLLDANLTNGVYLLAADFNGDGKIDIAAVQSNGPSYGNSPAQVRVYLNQGNNTFSAPATFYARNQDYFASIFAADFNNDGALDIGFVGTAFIPSLGYTETNLYVYAGNNKGAFTFLSQTPVLAGAVNGAAADFNADGNMDVVLDGANPYASPQLFLGNGNGTFSSESLEVPSNALGVQAISINSDKYPDLVFGPGPNAPGFAPLVNHYGNGVMVPKAATTATVTASSNSAYPGFEYIAVTVAKTSGTGTPTGNVTVNIGSSVSYTGTLITTGVYSGQVGLLPSTASLNPGNYTATINYGGDFYNSPSSTTVMFTVPYSTAITLGAAPQSVASGSNVTLSAAVVRENGAGNATGSMTFYTGTLKIGGPVTMSNGTAMLTAPTKGIAAGIYPVYAAYSGDTLDFSGNTNTVYVSIVPAGLDATTTSVVASPPSVTQGQSATLTVTVSDTTHSSTVPAGQVNLNLNGSSLGNFSLSNGKLVVPFSTASFSPGTYTLLAAYNGNSKSYRSESGKYAFIVKYQSDPVLSAANAMLTIGQDLVLNYSLSNSNFYPTGTYTLYADGAKVATLPASAEGSYILHTTGYAAGTYSLTLGYSGDTYNGPRTSPPVSVTLQAP